MKYFLVACLILINTTAFGQKIKGIEIIPEKKSELLRDLVERKQNLYEMFSREEIEDKFFPIHLNNDDKVDFIYNGFVGAESLGVEIYIAKNDGQFEMIKSELGIVENVIRKLPDLPAEIHFIQYGCCDDPRNYFQIWTVTSNRISETEKYFFLNKTELPSIMNYRYKIEVLNSPYYLRATPEITNDEFHYHYEKGNIIAEFSKGDTGYALDQRTDNTGRVWYFVIMNPPQGNGFHNYDIDRHEKWLGWMSSRFLDRND